MLLRTKNEIVYAGEGGEVRPSISKMLSSQFGDPCPDTPKYLELVYKCQSEEESVTSPSLPAWIMNMKSLPPMKIKIIKPTKMSTKKPKASKTTIAIDTTTLEPIRIESMLETNQYPQSLPFAQNFKVRFEEFYDKENIKNFVNEPKEGKTNEESFLNDNPILAAIIIASVSCFIIIFVGISVYIHREKNVDSQVYTVGSDSSTSTYLQYSESDPQKHSKTNNYIIGNDGQIYETIDINEVMPTYEHSFANGSSWKNQNNLKLPFHDNKCYQNSK